MDFKDSVIQFASRVEKLCPPLFGMLACASRTPDKSGFKTRIISNSVCPAEHAEQQNLITN